MARNTRAPALLAATALGVLCALTPPGHAQGKPRNLDFEAGAASGAVPGWFVPTPSHRVTLAKRGTRAGHCARLAPRNAGATGMGNLMQSVDATPFRGKHVRFRVSARRAAGPRRSRGQLWMRVDRRGGKRGFFANLGDQPIQSEDWQQREIVGEVAKDARAIAIGLMSIGGATLELDDVVLEALDPKLVPRPEAPRPLRGNALANVVAFARLAGCVRYFHPSSESRETDWDRFLIDNVRAVESARTPDDLVAELRKCFAFVAPTARIAIGKPKAPLPAALRPPKTTDQKRGVRVATWRHFGRGARPGRPGRPAHVLYHSTILEAPLIRSPLDALRGTAQAADLPKPDAPLLVRLPRGVACSLPLALYQKNGRTLPHMRGPEREPRIVPPTAADRATRLAGVITAWNVFQHFYPYFDVVETDWEAALPAALGDAAEDEDPVEFLVTLRELVAKLKDGHGYVGHPCDTRAGVLPVTFAMAEGKLVVECADRGARGARAGDTVVSIGGVPVRKVLDRITRQVSAATPQFRAWRALNELRRGVPGAECTLELANGSDTRSVVLRFGNLARALAPPRPEKIAELESGIFYVDVSRVDDRDFTGALERLRRAKAIVFDFRGYPAKLDAHLFFGHLIGEPVRSAQWHVPIPRLPDRRDMRFRATNRWTIRPRKPRLTARLAFVTDGRAISYAESCMGIVEHYGLGAIVGEATAGTNGNVNPLTLPGGYRVTWTGMKVLKHDGTVHHGVGILPTVKVARTVAGIRAGRDEYLEKAVELLR